MIGELSREKFKSKEIQREWDGIRPTLQTILVDMDGYCMTWEMPFCITDLTSTEAEDLKYNRKSATHREGRAADLRCKFWPEWFCKQFEEHFEAKYKSAAAVSPKTKKCNLIEKHVGTETHIHVQVRG